MLSEYEESLDDLIGRWFDKNLANPKQKLGSLISLPVYLPNKIRSPCKPVLGQCHAGHCIQELLSMVQWEPGSGMRGAVSVKTCLAAGGRSFMWLRNVTVCQICCTVKTFFQPGMAVQRMPCSRM